MGLDLKARFQSAVRLALGLDEDPGSTPRIDRLACYRAEVKACAADGSTVDVQPADPRIQAAQAIPMRVGIAGVTLVLKPGAIVLVGWEEGDPSRMYACPSFETGAGVTKVVLAADLVVLGAEGGSDFVALAASVNTQLSTLKTAISGAAVVANDGGAALKANIIAALASWPGSVAASQAKAK